jgi:hypothetical protein
MSIISKIKGPALGAGIAVVLLGGGVAAASQHWLITSTNQIKPSVVQKLRGATGATGAAGQTGQPGQPGPAGADGAPGTAVTVTGQTVVGPTGPAGANGTNGGFNLGSIHYRPAASYITVGAGVTQYVSAPCNDGESVIGGGETGYGIDVVGSYPEHNWTGSHPTDDAWEVEVLGTSTYGDVEAYAICVSSS